MRSSFFSFSFLFIVPTEPAFLDGHSLREFLLLFPKLLIMSRWLSLRIFPICRRRRLDGEILLWPVNHSLKRIRSLVCRLMVFWLLVRPNARPISQHRVSVTIDFCLFFYSKKKHIFRFRLAGRFALLSCIPWLLYQMTILVGFSIQWIFLIFLMHFWINTDFHNSMAPFVEIWYFSLRIKIILIVLYMIVFVVLFFILVWEFRVVSS